MPPSVHVCACVCKHLVTRCRIFRGHLLGKTTCLMLQLVLISDLHFPSHSDMFEFAFSTSKFTSRGCQGHQWVWHQRRHSLFACDMKKGRFLHVPAAFVKLLNKLLSYGVFTFNFRCLSDQLPTDFPSVFDQVSISFRLTFDRFRTVSTTPLRRTMTLRRTMFVIVLNRGLLQINALFRTIPDKHVELSSVCVSPPGATSSRLDGPSEKVQVRLTTVDVSKRNQGGLCAMD